MEHSKLGRYRRYDKYALSAASWQSLVPEHWQPVRFKHVLIDKKKISNPSLPAGSISFGRVVFKDSENLARETKDSYQEVLAGEYLVNPLNLNYDLLSLRTAMSEIDVVVSTGYIVLKSSGKLRPKYLRWLLHEFDVSHMKTLGAGVRQTINYADIGNSYFCEPTDAEQEAIAAFLDHETARIDALIAKQQRLIELLKEKRQAVISHAVTKGLNPNAPMKDSGLEWLGEVPAHWEITQPRYVCSFVGGGTPSKDNPDFWDGDIPWVSPKDMKVDFILDAQDHISTVAVKNSTVKLIRPGAVLMVVRGMILDHSVPVAVSKVHLTINQDMKALIPRGGLNEEYLLYCLRGLKTSILDLVESSAHGTKCLRTEQFDRMGIPLPPLPEQLEIVNRLKTKICLIDDLALNAESMIKLAQERLTALISAAVTGKIDVRDWQAAA